MMKSAAFTSEGQRSEPTARSGEPKYVLRVEPRAIRHQPRYQTGGASAASGTTAWARRSWDVAEDKRILVELTRVGRTSKRVGGVLSGGGAADAHDRADTDAQSRAALLDEPSEGLALLERVERLKRERITILLAGQGSSSRWRSPTRSMSLKKARVRHAGTAASARRCRAAQPAARALTPPAPAKLKFSGRSGFPRQTVERIDV